ncbi:MAG: bis(5'-nucleosyl)-tetraphosphatase (symmetrical) YqeK [Leptolyngbyaceae cyanobacterium]
MPPSLRQEVLQWLQTAVPEARLQHILRVEDMAIALAEHHAVDIAASQQAALMHDLAKCFSPDKLRAVAAAEGWELHPVEKAMPHLLHAPVGAIVARDRFGVRNDVVLRAIAAHTTGSPDLDGVGAIVYLADALEPGRGEDPQLQQLRQLSYVDLWGAVYETCVFSLQHLLKSKRLIHPRTILTHNRFMSARRQSSVMNAVA